MVGELPDALHFGGVEPLHLAAGAGYGQGSQQAQEIGAQVIQQQGFVAPRPAALPGFPILELLLRRRHKSADVAHAQSFAESVFAPFGYQENLIPQIRQRGVDRRGRQHQHFGAHTAGDDFFQQIPVALAVVIAEVMGFVDDHQAVIAPVEIGEVNAAGHPRIPRQIGMRQQGVAETIFGKRVLDLPVARLVQRPVFPQFLGAKHQYALVAQLKILDGGQRGVSFAQPHAVGQDAAVMLLQAGDDAPGAVFLKLIQGVPDLAAGEPGGVHIGVTLQTGFDFLAKKFVQRLEIHRLRRVIAAEAGQAVQRLPLDVLGAPPVSPEAVEPLLQLGEGGGVIDRQVDFQVGLTAAAQPAPGEVGAADDPGAAVGFAAKVHLAVQEVGLLDGADAYAVLRQPVGAPPRPILLL